MPFCPKCTQEFEGFARRCPDCEVDLVDQLAPAGAEAIPPAVLLARDEAAAARMADRLRALGLAVTTAEGGADGAIAVMVPARFLDAAAQLLAGDRALVRVEQEDDAEGPPAFRSFDPAKDRDTRTSVPDLLRLSVRQIAARGQEVVADLLDFIREGEGEAQRKAVLAVAAMGATGVSTLLRHAALLAREGREEAVYLIVRDVREAELEPEWLAPLLEVAEDPGLAAEPRGLALHALGRLGRAEAAPRLVGLLDDPDPAVREHADEALCTIADEDMGFDPEGEPHERAEAAARWRAFWRLS